MRCALILVIGWVSLLAGCAAQPGAAGGQGSRQRPQGFYQDVAAASLVFTPPVCLDQPPLFLSRDERQPSAFVGYDQSVTYYYLQMDDNQNNDGWNYTQRRAYSEKVGVSYR